MKKKRKNKAAERMTAAEREAAKQYPGKTTVGILFPGNRQVYTYLIRKNHGVKLGDEIVVDSPYGGPKTVFVVRLDKFPQVFMPGISYKEATRKVVSI